MINSLSFHTFISAVQGWVHGGQIPCLQFQEGIARQGVNRIPMVFSQLAQSMILSEQISFLERLEGRSYFAGSLNKFSYLVIPLLGGTSYLLSSKHDYPKLKKIVNKLEANIDAFIQIASLITSLAFFQFGYFIYPCFAFVSLSMHMLIFKKNIPPQILRICSKALRVSSKAIRIYLMIRPAISVLSFFLFKSWFLKVACIVDIVKFIFSTLFPKLFLKDNQAKCSSSIQYEHFSHESCLKNYEQFQAIFEERVALEVNREHVNICPFPQAVKQDFAPLLTLFNTLNWSDPIVLEAIKKSLNKDARWGLFIESEEIQKQLKKSESTVQIQYLKDQFGILINNIQNEKIQTGERVDYRILKNYLGYLTQSLPLAPSKIQQQIMMALAIEGGNYCATGIYHQLEIAVMSLLQQEQNKTGSEKQARLPFKQRLLLVLQQERLRIVQAYHLLIDKKLPMSQLSNGGQGSVPAFIHTIKLVSRGFGLPEQGADQDSVIQVFALEQLYFLWNGVSSDHVWRTACISFEDLTPIQGYTQTRILNALKSQSGDPLLPVSDFYDWAREWIANLTVSADTKADFMGKLQEGHAFATVDGRPKREFINAMLVDMGILKIVEHSKA